MNDEVGLRSITSLKSLNTIIFVKASLFGRAFTILKSSNPFYYLCGMSLLVSSNQTLGEIVSLIEELPKSTQQSILYQLKMKKALALANKIDKAAKPKFIISDQEIADIVQATRTAKK